jgi:N utilization substance protein A
MKGARIHGIVRELRNENIDVIHYTNNASLYIARALSPAKVQSIELDEENKKANVYLRPEDISLAIGKNGNNIKLATMLTGYTIDVFRNDVEIDEEDIYLDEFSDEIDSWIIDVLKGIGCDTAKNVLSLTREELIQRSDLEEETIDDVLAVLKAEFEEKMKDPAFAKDSQAILNFFYEKVKKTAHQNNELHPAWRVMDSTQIFK